MIKENIFISHSNGKSWLAWMLVPFIVYGALLMFWANRMNAQVWPDEWGDWLRFAIGFGILSMAIALNMYQGRIEGAVLTILVLIPVLSGVPALLIYGYQNGGVLAFEAPSFKVVLFMCSMFPSSVLFYRAIRF
ncbi:hypothetical protein EXT56_22275 [Pectobacterium carotovorum subsp. carotovorum]|nr:hypothetical protein [Pectobacterium carotovorum]MCL6349530.1 hypothetical protein [Pectobacterium carotovorum subsp. carotovorum]